MTQTMWRVTRMLWPPTPGESILSDGEIAQVTADDIQVYRLDGRLRSIYELLEEQWTDGEKGDYPHFMLKEIYEQPDALRHCLSGRINIEQGTAHLGGLVMSPQKLTQITRVGLLDVARHTMPAKWVRSQSKSLHGYPPVLRLQVNLDIEIL